jgi:hypothetical protein
MFLKKNSKKTNEQTEQCLLFFIFLCLYVYRHPCKPCYIRLTAFELGQNEGELGHFEGELGHFEGELGHFEGELGVFEGLN